MITAHFHGSLAKKYGKTHKYDAPTVYLLMQGLVAQLGDEFRDTIKNNKWHINLGKKLTRETQLQSEEQVHQQLGKTTEVHFYPEVTGDASGRWIQAIIGVVLIVVGLIIGYFTGNYWNPVTQMGVSMLLGGVMSALAQKPTVATQGGASNPSYFFNGGQNTNAQGVPVPLVFGRCGRAGSVMISQAITAGAVT